MAINMESTVKYIVDKDLFSKAFCVFVSAYSMSVIYSLWNHTELSGLMGISKFLEWVHFDALAKPFADVATFLQQEPLSGSQNIICIVGWICMLVSAIFMKQIRSGGLQIVAFTLWVFVLWDFHAFNFLGIFSLIFLAALSFSEQNPICLRDKKSRSEVLESMIVLIFYIGVYVVYIPLVFIAIFSGMWSFKNK
ncbi:hypothetical protein [Rothia mucilaginosa]|uniref:hypothetical protein n=1 Tax=Rothia mucilaginosa TaxID=43675 RepID=UPI00288C3DA1|nr:hypothetical protein [Rothia mucilaginosa]